MNYFKILFFLEKGNRRVFDFPKEEQLAYLNRLGEAKDDIDRGFKQYLCQNQLVRPKWKIVVFNLAGILGLPLTFFYFLLKRITAPKAKSINCLIEKKGMPEVVPDVVKEKFHPSEDYEVKSSLGLRDIAFAGRLYIKAPLHPYFVFKAMMNVARYSHLIYSYSPKVMIQFGEFSFSSSILTAYCHQHSVLHVDVMHGEKLFNIRDAYFHYDKTYVWNDHYTNLLTSLNAESSQFVVAPPQSLVIDCDKYVKPEVYADFKYYLASYNEETIKRIVKSMIFAKHRGKSVKYRPHPRYSNLELLKKYVSEDEIEYGNQVTIQESISNLMYAVGSYTTVMVQAYFSGKHVIMDDVAEKDEYDLLKSLDYILSTIDGVDKLSNYQNEMQSNIILQ